MHEADSRVETAEPPEWFARAVTELVDLVRLPAGWNSYGADPIEPTLIGAAVCLLATDAMRADLPEPIITPTNRGGVVLEWHTRGIDLEIEVREPGFYHLSYEDLEHGTELEADFHHDHQSLAEAFDELVRHQP